MKTLSAVLELNLVNCTCGSLEEIGRAVPVLDAAVREYLLSDEVIERTTRAAAEADGQVWEGLSSKMYYANMIGAALSAALGEE